MRSWLDLWPKLKIGDTALITKLEMVDQNPWAAYPEAGYSDDPAASGRPTSKKNNISVERCYIHHNFTPDITMEAGLMDGAWWGTSFMDTMAPRYRVKFIDTKTPVGLVGALFEKDTETGGPIPGTTTITAGADRDDGDAYAIFGVTKVGDIYFKPLIFYVPNSNLSSLVASKYNTPDPLVQAGLPATTDVYLTSLDKGVKGLTVVYYALESDGKLGPLSFESEMGLKTYRSSLNENLYAVGT